jgi:hypothetical protein
VGPDGNADMMTGSRRGARRRALPTTSARSWRRDSSPRRRRRRRSTRRRRRPSRPSATRDSGQLAHLLVLYAVSL